MVPHNRVFAIRRGPGSFSVFTVGTFSLCAVVPAAVGRKSNPYRAVVPALFRVGPKLESCILVWYSSGYHHRVVGNTLLCVTL